MVSYLDDFSLQNKQPSISFLKLGTFYKLCARYHTNIKMKIKTQNKEI